MHLELSPHNPLNATYYDTESGRAEYRVQTEFKAHNSVTTISRRIESDVPRRNSAPNLDALTSSASGAEGERFGLLAKISWRVVGSSIIQFGEREIDTGTFFKVKGFGLFGLESGFTALDGKEYRWRKKINRTTLEMHGQPDTLVADFKGKSMGIIGEARKPSLEIPIPYEYMADEIMVTFIYVEKTRKS
ncbi:hypothetical protein MSAN_00863000 [Mycena sanguinolenta]|uniref:DUF6593 domain-containing protein n=1 Tax=Mycena sanguinolenta TaxID=230812 RepID=A0A8H7DB57_9AGAR|nr:hypothetical protein MSAN_00863000 [Mycena sanguinolenta]